MSTKAEARTAAHVARASRSWDGLVAIHTIAGATFPVPWEIYRRELSTEMGFEGPILDAMARLGHFHVTPGSVTFLRTRP